MVYRKIAFLVLLAACSLAARAQDAFLTPNSTLFYFSIPLDGETRKESGPAYGFMLRGSRPYEVLNFDSRMYSRFLEAGLAGLELKLLIAGGAVAAAAATISAKDSSVTHQQAQQQAAQQQQQQQQQQTPPAPCPQACPAWVRYLR